MNAECTRCGVEFEKTGVARFDCWPWRAYLFSSWERNAGWYVFCSRECLDATLFEECLPEVMP